MDNPYFSSLQHVIDYMQKYFELEGSRGALKDFDITSDRHWPFECCPYSTLPNVDQEWIRECFNKTGMGYWEHKLYPNVTLLERHGN